MSSHTCIPIGAVANVQAFSGKTGAQRDNGHIARTAAEILSLVTAHNESDRVHVHFDTDFRNSWTEEEQIREMREDKPDRLFLYMRKSGIAYELITWLGTPIGASLGVGGRVRVGFGGSYRRSVHCAIFGTLYHGWYYESSGDYVRLTKSKRQAR